MLSYSKTVLCSIEITTYDHSKKTEQHIFILVYVAEPVVFPNYWNLNSFTTSFK